MIEVPANIKNIVNKIITSGGNIYLVGGYVRDYLILDFGIKQNEQKNDMDFCITGFSQDSFEELFPEALIRGKDFPVYIMENCEFALARIERKITEGHKGFRIISSPDITIEEDLLRRDFTVNSIAYDLKNNNLVDPFNGKEDIKNRILRATSPAFAEDPLRVYRAARFSACLRFDIEQDTIDMMQNLKSELKSLSEERVFEEIRKALGAKEPSRFFNVLRKAELLDVHFQEINQLIGVLQPERYHPEGDAFNHTMIVLDKAAEMTDSEEIRFAALVHDVGKGVTEPSKWPRHIGHDRAGVELVERMAERLKLPSSWKNAGKGAALLHMKAWQFKEMRPETKVEFLEAAAKTKLGLSGMEIIAEADGKGANFSSLGERLFKEVNGKTLGVDETPSAAIIIRKARVEWLKTQKD